MSNVQPNFILKAHNLIDLIIPPAQDPFSDYEPVRDGESVLTRAIRRWEATGSWDFSSIIIHLPSEKLKEINTTLISQKFTHYLRGQLEGNNEHMFFFKKNLIRVFRNAFMFLTLCMVLVTIVSNPSFLPHLPQVLRKVLTEGFTVIGWVVLWRPVELVINEFGQLRKQNKIYQKLLKASIQFMPDDNF